MTSPVALSVGQAILWEDVSGGSTPALQNFQGTMPSNSVKCTCQGHNWMGTLTKLNTNSRLQMVIPAISAASTAVTDVVCAKGEVSCKAREWSSGTTAATEITATCYACSSSDDDCTKVNS
jgi:hypothetical protein